MNNYEFVEIINTKIKNDVVDITEKELNDSSSKYELLKELSEWYAGKDEAERQTITKLIRNVYDHAAWRILCLLDDETKYGGRFELCFVDDDTNEKTQMIDPPNLYDLHDLYEHDFKK